MTTKPGRFAVSPKNTVLGRDQPALSPADKLDDFERRAFRQDGSGPGVSLDDAPVHFDSDPLRIQLQRMNESEQRLVGLKGVWLAIDDNPRGCVKGL